MIREPLTASQRQSMFDQLLELALQGDPPPTENGLGDAVEQALTVVAWKRTPESADAARSVFEASQ